MTADDYKKLGFKDKQAKKLLNNSEYWVQRAKQLEESQNKKGLDTYFEIEQQYRKAQKEIENKINTWYQRLADNNKISLAEARKMISGNELKEFKWDVNDYIKYGKENAINGKWIKELENASAKFHISKYEALKIQTQQSLEVMFGNQLDKIDSTMRKIYTDGYFRNAYELQKGIGVGWNIAGIDQPQLDKIIMKPWAIDGKNFSERIWENKEKLISEVHKELTQNIILGNDPQKVIDNIAKKMNTSKTNAGRLVMTEKAYFSALSQKDCFKELGVEEYKIVATLDSVTSEICQTLDGQHFPLKDFQPGTTAPPFHVNCRSTTAPYFKDNFGYIGERSARGKDGKTYYVPGNMDYKEWKKTFVDGMDKPKLQKTTSDDKIEIKKFDIEGNTTKLKSAMSALEYNAYLERLNNHNNNSIKKLYSNYADGVSEIKCSKSRGQYSPVDNSIIFSYPEQKYLDNGMDKYSTVAHEYGHYFDIKCNYEGLTFNEIDSIHKNINYASIVFKKSASSSDEFLAAVREDRKLLKSKLTSEIMEDLRKHHASNGVQDAIDGLLGKRISWGHGDTYYNRKYSAVKKLNEQKGLKRAYEELGFDLSNQAKVQYECRIYEAASEMWANIMAAEVNGGESLKYVKEYLPNSYKAMIKILERVN